jgi:hypothetical protein
MRIAALILAASLGLTACSGTPNPTGSTTPPSKTYSPSSSSSATPSQSETAAKTLPTSIEQARGVLVKGSNSQVKCQPGETLYISSQIQMQAEDLDELFAVANMGCQKGATKGFEIPEVFHWKNNSWISVATIRVEDFDYNSTGACSAVNTLKVRCPVTASDDKGSFSSTISIFRKDISYWAVVAGR